MLRDLIKNYIQPVKTSQIGHEVMSIMDENKVLHLPIVNNTEFLGIISESDLYSNALQDAIGRYRLTLNFSGVEVNDHIFDVLQYACDLGLTIIPVVNNRKYLGYIDLQSLIAEIGKILSVNSPGSTIEIELNIHDYYFSKIVQIIESNDVKILHSSIYTYPDSTKMILTLKLDKIDISAVLQTLTRHEYEVIGSYGVDDDSDMLQDRYNMLIHYLNI